MGGGVHAGVDVGVDVGDMCHRAGKMLSARFMQEEVWWGWGGCHGTEQQKQ
jgi:hypothetical protein